MLVAHCTSFCTYLVLGSEVTAVSEPAEGYFFLCRNVHEDGQLRLIQLNVSDFETSEASILTDTLFG